MRQERRNVMVGIEPLCAFPLKKSYDRGANANICFPKLAIFDKHSQCHIVLAKWLAWPLEFNSG